VRSQTHRLLELAKKVKFAQIQNIGWLANGQLAVEIVLDVMWNLVEAAILQNFVSTAGTRDPMG
jgi:hypothetical protein